MNEIPRRNRLDLNWRAELAIREAVAAVEDMGAHQLLTEAVILLGQAREKVADYVDNFGTESGDVPNITRSAKKQSKVQTEE